MAVFQGLKSDLDELQTSYRPFRIEERDESESEEDERPPQHFLQMQQERQTNTTAGQRWENHGGKENETPYGDQEVPYRIHMVPESGKSKWSHIDDLDSFFSKVYDYHQKHGFTVMMLQECLELLQFIFVVWFTVFLAECLNYSYLFKDSVPPGMKPGEKLALYHVVSWPPYSSMHFLTQAFVTISSLFWLTRAIVVLYHVFQFWDIKCFFNTALDISDDSLDSVTWWEVQNRLVKAQEEHMMCIHKQSLTNLDVYHRILRYTNYLVAMVNKSLIPLRFNVPFLGDYVFLSTGLRFNLELILFKSPWAPFNQWHLREDFKRVGKRKELAATLKSHILILGCVNLVLMPIILLWQILYSFFNYAEVIKREPGSLGVRKWSLFGRYYLRHFNELDHELSARLSRAYKPASYYMDIFVSPLATVIAKNVAFICGSVLAVLLALAVYDEDVVTVEHVVTLMTGMGAAVAGARVFIPDENQVFCPERTMTQVVAHIHYFPVQWRGQSHTHKVMSELDLLFRYTAMYLIDEVLSPIICPLILIFSLSHKSQEIVDFFRNFTVDVVGVGDVCSFAQMDVRRHGHPGWQPQDQEPAGPGTAPVAKTNQYTQAEDGKTEMSLLHFTLTNPGWKPAGESERYLAGLRDAATKDLSNLPQRDLGALQEQQEFSDSVNPMASSLSGLEQMGGSYKSMALNLVAAIPSPPPPTSPLESQATGMSQGAPTPVLKGGGISRMAGPLTASRSTLLGRGVARPPSPLGGLEYSQADMAMSALYLHNVNHRAAANRPPLCQVSSYRFQRTDDTVHAGSETQPLIGDTEP